MSLFINTNIAALNAQRNLASSRGALGNSLQRLSSGLRVNSTRDDAAGMAIGSRMTAQIHGLDQAHRNTNDGISLAQTAEGALQQSTDILQRIRVLAVQSANATNSTSDRAALNSEANQLISELDRIANTTQFNGLNLLNGTYRNQQFQIGADTNQSIDLSLASARSADLYRGNNILTLSGTNFWDLGGFNGWPGNTVGNSYIVNQTLTVSGSEGTAAIAISAGSSAAQIAAAVNASTAATGVKATAATTEILSAVAAGMLSFSLNGGGTQTAISATVGAGGNMRNVAAAINAVSVDTGVSARTDVPGTSLTLSQAAGNDIILENLVHSANSTMQITASNGASFAIGFGTIYADSRAYGTVSLSSEAGFTAVSDVAGSVGSGTVLGTTVTAATVANFTVGSIDISSIAGANTAIDTVDAALTQVNSMRANLGAAQNRFLSVINNLQAMSENLTSARSRLLDTDFAAETASLTRNQILQQAGTAMLAQANALPNRVLSLLR